jgi:hypothetical protein
LALHATMVGLHYVGTLSHNRNAIGDLLWFLAIAFVFAIVSGIVG